MNWILNLSANDLLMSTYHFARKQIKCLKLESTNQMTAWRYFVSGLTGSVPHTDYWSRRILCAQKGGETGIGVLEACNRDILPSSSSNLSRTTTTLSPINHNWFRTKSEATWNSGPITTNRHHLNSFVASCADSGHRILHHFLKAVMYSPASVER
jgi:hypothetical protein